MPALSILVDSATGLGCGKEAFSGESFQNLEIQIAFHPDCGFNVANESMEFEVEVTRRHPLYSQVDTPSS
jgi:hypothetical protein